MAMIRYSFNRQVRHLCQESCYIAFGHREFKDILEQRKGKRNQIGFKVDIAKQVYEMNRLSGFKYADHGITPKSIAHEIELHLTKKKDLQWKIDEFGSFIFTPTPHFLAKIKQQLLQNQTYHHQNLQQFQQLSHKMKQQQHYFDFYIHEQLTLHQFLRISQMSIKSLILSHLNNHKVHHTIYRQNSSSACTKNIQKIIQLVFMNKQIKIQSQQQLYNHHRIINGIYTHQYFGCDRWNTVHFQKQLPKHVLVNSFIENDDRQILGLTNAEILQTVLKNKQKRISRNRKYSKIQPTQDNKQNIIIAYGNLIDQHKFDEIESLLASPKTNISQINEISQQLKILKKSYEFLTTFHS